MKQVVPHGKQIDSMNFIFYDTDLREMLFNARNKQEVLFYKRQILLQKWAARLIEETDKLGIEFDLPMGTINTGRFGGFKIIAREHTKSLKEFLANPNYYHLCPWDFEGKPIISMDGKRVQVVIGFPSAVVDPVIPLPLSDVYNLEPGEFLLGQDENGEQVKGKLGDTMPHIFLNGLTGSGKSEAIRSLVYQFSMSGCDMVLADLKDGSTLFGYDKLQGVIASLATTDDEVRRAIQFVTNIMSERYTLLREEGDLDNVPPLVFVVDELKELTKDTLDSLNKIARQGRQAKVHLILSIQNATQKNLEGVDVKRNIPGRIALKTDSKSSSEVVLDGDYDASALLGRGDCYFCNGEKTVRVQCYLLDKAEVKQEMCYSPRLSFGTPGTLALSAPTEDPYRALVEQLVRERPRAGQPAVRAAIEQAGLAGIGTEKIRALLADARNKANQGQLTT